MEATSADPGGGRPGWLIGEALERLTPVHRQVLIECFYRGRSVADAAVRLGLPATTVKSRTYYALRTLRLVLAEIATSTDFDQ